MKTISVDIEGKTQDIDVPDDYTDEDLDDIVNQLDTAPPETAPPETAPATVSTTAPKQPGVLSKIGGAMDQAETAAGEGAYKDWNLIKEAATRPNTNLPTRIAETTGNALGSIVRGGMNLANVPLAGAGALVKQAFPYTTSKIGQLMTDKRKLTPWSQGEGTSVVDALGAVGAPMRRAEKDWPRTTQQLKNILSVEQVLPYGKLAQVAGKPIVAGTAEALEAATRPAIEGEQVAREGMEYLSRKTGEGLESFGKKTTKPKFSSISETDLKEYAGGPSSSAEEGMDALVNDMSNLGVDSRRGVSASIPKVDNRVALEMANRENMLDRFVAQVRPSQAHNLDMEQIINDLKDGVVRRSEIADELGIGLPNDVAKAIKTLDGIAEDLKARDLYKELPPAYIPEVKRIIERDTHAFKKGYIPDKNDLIQHNIGKLTYFKAMDALNDVIAPVFPEFAISGRNLRKLIGIKGILEKAKLRDDKKFGDYLKNAAMRVAGESAAGFVLGDVGGAAGVGGIGLGIDLGQKIVRTVGPSQLMKTGRFLQGKSTKLGKVKALSEVEKENYRLHRGQEIGQYRRKKSAEETRAEFRARADAKAKARAKAEEQARRYEPMDY